MAKITAQTRERVYRIRQFLGLNQCDDGDTQLKLGEAAEMRNWQVTPHQHLRVRPGSKCLRQFSGPVRGLWSGCVAGRETLLCATDGGIWELRGENFCRIGDSRDVPTEMFGFGGKVYFLNGWEYLVWDGEGFVDTVDGYVPLVVTAMSPSGGGTPLENVNRLTGRRRCRFSADGAAKEYCLPEQDLLSVDKVTVGTEEVQGWTADCGRGLVTFAEAPAAGTNNVEIRYSAKNTLRPQVEGMRFAELFNGAADTRVFLYGDGSARAIYCGVTEEGLASAEYFPDLYDIRVGSENAPITAMIKYYDRLMTYKSDGGAYATRYEVTELADGSSIPGFFTVSINRQIGNDPMGQVRLVKNTPRTIFGGQVYDWVMANYITRDERNAKYIGQRIRKSMEQADPEKLFCFDDDAKQEYYIFLGDEAGTALVHQYDADVWYCYTALPAVCAARLGKNLYFGTSDGRLLHFDRCYASDDGRPIDALYVSGHMDFDRDNLLKYSAEVLVSVKPTAHANLTVAMGSDRGSSLPEKQVCANLSTFDSADFTRWSFLTGRSPQMRRLKLKLKRFVYDRLILKSCDRASDATVAAVDIPVRYAGRVR